MDDEKGYMADNVEDLTNALVGRRIVSVVTNEGSNSYPDYGYATTVLTLDDGTSVEMMGGDDCCAYTELDAFFLNPNSVDHVITHVKVEDNFQTWYVLADMEEILKLDVSWSEGSGYYSYGFAMRVKTPES